MRLPVVHRNYTPCGTRPRRKARAPRKSVPYQSSSDILIEQANEPNSTIKPVLDRRTSDPKDQGIGAPPFASDSSAHGAAARDAVAASELEATTDPSQGLRTLDPAASEDSSKQASERHLLALISANDYTQASPTRTAGHDMPQRTTSGSGLKTSEYTTSETTRT